MAVALSLKTEVLEDDIPISSRRAAELLRISDRTVRRLAEAGVIRGKRVGRQWRLSKRSVLELRP